MKNREIKVVTITDLKGGEFFIGMIPLIFTVLGVVNYPQLLEDFTGCWIFGYILIFLFCWLAPSLFLIFLIRKKMKKRKFISSSLHFHFRYGQQRWIEVVKLKDGQVFIFDQEDQVLLNAPKNDLAKMFKTKIPVGWKIEEGEDKTNFLAKSTIQIEIDESSKVDLPISLNITLNEDIKPEELCEFIEDSAKEYFTSEKKNIVDFSQCLIETLLFYKNNEEKIKEAVKERVNERITSFEMKDRISKSIIFPKILSSFEEVTFDIEDILVFKNINILEK